jgi:hypothetical protein
MAEWQDENKSGEEKQASEISMASGVLSGHGTYVM